MKMKYLFVFVVIKMACGIASATTTLSVPLRVDMDVAPSCFFDANPDIDMGQIPRTITSVGGGVAIATTSPVQRTGVISVVCTTGYAYKVYSNTGLNYDGANRRLISASGASYLSYKVSADAYSGADFPTSTVGALSYTGTGSSNQIPLYVVIPVQALSGVQLPGIFSDTLTFTAVF